MQGTKQREKSETKQRDKSETKRVERERERGTGSSFTSTVWENRNQNWRDWIWAVMAATSYLTATQRYAAGALFGLALHQAQLHQTHPLGLSPDDFPSESESPVAVSEDPSLWAHHNSALLRPVFKYLDIDSAAWSGLEETAGSPSATRHVGPVHQELALSEAVDAMVLRLEKNSDSPRSRREKLREYEHQCREKFSTADAQPNAEKVDIKLEAQEGTGTATPFLDCEEPHEGSIGSYIDRSPVEEVMILSYQRKLTVLYELLSACLSDLGENNKTYRQRRKGYDARHRVTLRLLATWLDIKWAKMEAIETIVSSSAMAFVKEQESSKEETQAKESKWAKWKRGGIIGAAALTGGTLMAITGAAGAGLTGSKMARRVGDVDEFEFKAIGENHNQGDWLTSSNLFGFQAVLLWGLVDSSKVWCNNDSGSNNDGSSYGYSHGNVSGIATELMRQGAMMTVMHALLTALAWPATLFAATEFIDSVWTIAIDRADKAGKLLAEVLLGGLQGNRPVTLVGYSLGARVIFKCLEFLAETENSAELVERVVLLGAPIAIKDENWEAARKMVAGRFVNAYSRNDWMLGIAFRASLLSQGLAGIQPVDVPGVQNIDVTNHIEGHSSYLWATQRVLDELELDSYYPVYNNTPSDDPS
ncbi:hypothetical protein Fmac_002581 [Flemingia macrophylla]|uniref:Uncharacterized protein n=1 Tax=Flemingia macrophylla TaxID=520843 RepID=A0ABD1NKB5_9FABA